MNPLWPPSSSSRKGRGSVTPAAAQSASVHGAPAAAATSPPLPSLQAAGFPAWWTNSSPMASTERLYPQGGFTHFLESNGSSENFHLVGNTTSRTTNLLNSKSTPEIAPSLKRTRPVESNARDKETIAVDVDEDNEERTEKRLSYTKDEDVRLASAWLRNSKDQVDGTDRSGDQYWQDVTDEYNKSTEVCRRRNRNQLKDGTWDFEERASSVLYHA